MKPNREIAIPLIHLKIHRRAGSVFLLSVGILALLSILSTLVFTIVSNRHRQAFQTTSWQESILAAESGVDIAVAELRRKVSDPTTAFGSWTHEDGAISMTTSTLLRGGEGGRRSWTRVVLEAPPSLVDSTGSQWYRIRSTGYAEVPGKRGVGGDPMDVKLRKLDFYVDHRKHQPILSPQASRLVEVIVKPVGAFRLALLADKRIDMNNGNIVVDSYDSRDPSKSTNGFYDPAKRQKNGDIASNGPMVDVGNAHIYGDASTNQGSVINATNVTGQIRDDFYQELYPVVRPDMIASPSTPSSVNGTTVVDGSAGVPTMLIFSQIKLSNTEILRIRGAADGSPTYAQILVNGDVDLGGKAQIILDPGVYVRIFVVGDGNFTAGGVANPNSTLSFQLYGVKPTGDNAAGKFKISGHGGFRGAVYAPNYDIEIVGGGSTDNVFGSIVGKSVNMRGGQAIHYDEAMSDGGLISDYRVVSWFEDTR